MKIKGLYKLTVLFPILLVSVFTSSAIASTFLDPGFGIGGKVTTTIAANSKDGIRALVYQPDGKLVAAGRTSNGTTFNNTVTTFALVRYNADGSLDTGFGTGGKVTTAIHSINDVPLGYDEISALVLQPDGKLVAAGFSYNGLDFDVALARYNADGSLDTGFGVNGKVTTPIGVGDDSAHALVLQPDGKLVVAGASKDGVDDEFNMAHNDIALVRYNADGSLDAGFGAGGTVVTAVSVNNDVASALVVQADGKLVVAGSFDNGAHDGIVLVRYNANGNLDTSFGTGGKVVTSAVDGSNVPVALVLQPDGKLVAGGYFFALTPTSFIAKFLMVRYLANGSLDSGFGSNGKVTTLIDQNSRAFALVLQPDGKLVAAGLAYQSQFNSGFALARYNVNGSLDTSFGAGGKVTTAFANPESTAFALVLQPDGKLVAAGHSGSITEKDFALVRYVP